ncbi:hypothetical protein GCM10022249_01670 [Enteractinococcus coprophilus]
MLLEALRVSEDKFFAVLSKYAGRHAVIFGSQSESKIVSDATGMRAVFYAGEGGVVASHALLVEHALGGISRKDELPFKYGYPGNRTPYLRTKLLIPNTYYDVANNSTRRFWPTRQLNQRSVDEVAAECLEAATNAFRNMARGRVMNMALTAGLDSRVIFAVGLNSGFEFSTYTYGLGNDTKRDRLFAADLAACYGVSHSVVPHVRTSKELALRLDEANFATHHKAHVGALSSWFGSSDAVAVSGNLLEIGRSFYQAQRRKGVKGPVTAGAMRNLHTQAMGPKVRDAIEAHGKARFDDVSLLGFQSYIEDSEFFAAADFLDPFDQFYWEHRMSAWHGVSMLERDFYGVAFIPFNSRSIFEAMLSVPVERRDDSTVFHRMIEMVEPGLLGMPVNPKEWPLPVQP